MKSHVTWTSQGNNQLINHNGEGQAPRLTGHDNMISYNSYSVYPYSCSRFVFGLNNLASVAIVEIPTNETVTTIVITT
ncbi:Uncharacterized protein HZ326_18402 [Fusarium oxysporum f. sp. albedinis]|nr:Uncharacterized protein HZ326_18402 [Fusarium oxysporum f. sp. albedinis]